MIAAVYYEPEALELDRTPERLDALKDWLEFWHDAGHHLTRQVAYDADGNTAGVLHQAWWLHD